MREPMLHEGELQRGLQNRHIQLIALGGAIGTGLFLGSAGVLKSAGPSMILGYAIAGCIAFLIMRQLGEMIVEEPVAGSFSHFAHNYWGGYAGTAFFIDPKERLVAVMMSQAPEKRQHYRNAFRANVYQAINE